MTVKFVPLKDQFERNIRTATRKAGRSALNDIKKQRVKSLGKVSSRRKKGVKGGISKDGEAIMIADRAPLAKAQEFGLEIKPKNGQYLRVRINKPTMSENRSFIRNDKKGNPHIFEKVSNTKLRLLATLKKSVRIKRISKGLLRIAAERFPKYMDDIEKELLK